MKKNPVFSLLRQFSLPVLLIFLGLVLVILPDSAAVLVSAIIAWVLAMGGVAYLLFSLVSLRRVTHALTGAVCLLLGAFLLKNPLFLARNLGRVLGILLAVEGIDSLTKYNSGRFMGLAALVGAFLLLTAPMTASRMVFRLCGLLLVAIAAGQILMQLRFRRFQKEDDDPNIIDAL